ncbi:glycoside hydrolase family 55 protein [Cercophora scortea]|uniref:Glycoside hydrolase family 55 protein n=1 Tax=Cercophora scortea TaxID=314031 RepID=A0AAE0IX21_9PEZI|nr:glycoside hydrolase family 55 protein [Cercophora scortea]
MRSHSFFLSLSALASVCSGAAVAASQHNGAISTSPAVNELVKLSEHPGDSSKAAALSDRATAPAVCTDYWLGKIAHQGLAPYGGAGYKVFRNVKDYGAKGDGVTDDTAAINRAISDGNRCGPGCVGSTKTPGIIYFPPGTYIVSSPIIDFYYTQIIGNPSCLPVIKASAKFSGAWVLDGNQYGANGLAWSAVNVFWRQVSNLVIDLTGVPATTKLAGIHWPTAQATSLSNIVFRMSQASNTMHQGLFIEEGSGGFIGDLVFYGGAQALVIGNQQFTMRNLTIYNAKTAIQQLWSWGWTYQGVSINNCQLGFDFTAVKDGGLLVGSVVIFDSEINNTPVGISYGNSGASGPAVGNSLMIENVKIKNVPTAIRDAAGTVLAGTTGTTTIAAWGRGHTYSASGALSTFQGATFPASARPASVVAGAYYYTRSKPSYATVPVAQFASARAFGAKADGVADDTNAINNLLATALATGKIAFFDAGIYRVTNTIRIPAGSRITGEAFPVIMSSGAFFANSASPQPVVQVGTSGAGGSIEWSNMIVSTQGAQPGAILIQYNLASSSTTPSGMWDVHVRVGGFAGSNQQLSQCPKTPGTSLNANNIPKQCLAAFMSMHVTKASSGLLMENCWIWVADHDVEAEANNAQISLFVGRGLLIESAAGNIWLYGTSVEHHQRYQYQLVNTRNVIMGQIQTETAYYQTNPGATLPFGAVAAYSDPTFALGNSGWGVRIVGSTKIFAYGAGLYSFFKNYDVTCSQIGKGANCQPRILSVENSSVRFYNLNTVGTTNQISVNGNDIANYASNVNGFVHTIALFRM